jgi:nucleoside-diphosphate kinase
MSHFFLLCALCASVSGFALTPSVASSRATMSVSSAPITMAERTYIMIKPDGVQRGLVGKIIERFEQRGYKLQALKLKQASEELLREHYKDLTGKGFFPSLLSYMLSGPVTCMVWEGKEAVKMGRQMLGATNPQESLPGTIRGDFSIEVGRNICHGSDSVENAEKEIALWFTPEELCEWEDHSNDWLYE